MLDMGRSLISHRSGLLREFNSSDRSSMGFADVQSRLSHPYFCRISDPFSGKALYKAQQWRIMVRGGTFDLRNAWQGSVEFPDEFYRGSNFDADRRHGGVHLRGGHQGA